MKIGVIERRDDQLPGSIGPILVDDQVRVGIIFEAFTHFLPIAAFTSALERELGVITFLPSQNQTGDNQILPRGGAEKVS